MSYRDPSQGSAQPSPADPHHTHATNGDGDGSEFQLWRDRSRIVLSPVAAPSILGLYGFAGATFMVSSNLAGWWGTPQSQLIIFPFAAMFGGLAQFLAGMWAYKARDGLATAMHGTWGAFWLAYGILFSLFATKALPMPVGTLKPAFGFWFIVLCVVTAFGALAATAENGGLFITLLCLAAGSGLLAAAFIGGFTDVQYAGGWVLVASSAAAIYTASAMMLEGSFGRVILPLLKPKAAANIPGRAISSPIEYPSGMPGARVGQ
ncbi:MAG: acetate uptake transporter family protein [Acidimicrobiales bacterium]